MARPRLYLPLNNFQLYILHCTLNQEQDGGNCQHKHRNTIPLSVTDRYKLSGISYDRNGNLKTLKRWGITNAATNTSNLTDDLTYGYYGGATVNTLRKVSDAVSTSYGLSPEMDLPGQGNVNNKFNLEDYNIIAIF